MKNSGLILILLLLNSFSYADGLLPSAFLQVITLDGAQLSVESQAKIHTEQHDPLVCRRAKLALGNIQKIDQELLYLNNQINSHIPTVQELNTLQALQMKRNQDMSFLSLPAPELLVSWDLGALAIENHKSLVNESVQFDLRSQILDWNHVGSFSTPEMVSIYYNYFDKTLNLILRMKISSFCFQDDDVNLLVQIL